MEQRLLIADRDTELCEVFRRVLTERGYEVETSTDGLDCLAKNASGDAGRARAGSGASVGWR